jgi:hypothetical protein
MQIIGPDIWQAVRIQKLCFLEALPAAGYRAQKKAPVKTGTLYLLLFSKAKLTSFLQQLF